MTNTHSTKKHILHCFGAYKTDATNPIIVLTLAAYKFYNGLKMFC